MACRRSRSGQSYLRLHPLLTRCLETRRVWLSSVICVILRFRHTKSCWRRTARTSAMRVVERQSAWPKCCDVSWRIVAGFFWCPYPFSYYFFFFLSWSWVPVAFYSRVAGWLAFEKKVVTLQNKLMMLSWSPSFCTSTAPYCDACPFYWWWSHFADRCTQLKLEVSYLLTLTFVQRSCCVRVSAGCTPSWKLPYDFVQRSWAL